MINCIFSIQLICIHITFCEFAGLWQKQKKCLSSVLELFETQCRPKMRARDSNRTLGRKNYVPTVFVRKRSTPKNPNGYTSTTSPCRKYHQHRYLNVTIVHRIKSSDGFFLLFFFYPLTVCASQTIIKKKKNTLPLLIV